VGYGALRALSHPMRVPTPLHFGNFDLSQSF
jgi:hypothetical protein